MERATNRVRRRMLLIRQTVRVDSQRDPSVGVPNGECLRTEHRGLSRWQC
jgi:hypothetical protein